MFKSNVTQNYTQQDATMEILIMLAGAFLLGILLCWLIRKLLNINTQYTNTKQPLVETKTRTTKPLNNNERQNPVVITKNQISSYNIPRTDDLTKIVGIDSDVESELKARNINSYIDLRDIEKQTIEDTLKTPKAKFTSIKEAHTWPRQASLAAKGDWGKLTEYQAFMARTSKAAEEVQNTKKQQPTREINLTSKKNDLKNIEGIGPKIEEILNTNGIKSFRELSLTHKDTLKGYLDEAGDRFKMHDPKSWPHQAGMADRGEWDDLKLYQEFMDGGREETTPASSIQKNKTPENTGSPTSLEKPTHFKSNLSNKNDDLKKVEGIGPKIESVLNNADIKTFEDLKNSTGKALKILLDDAGPQYKMHDPKTWPHQAGLAFKGKWDELKEYQDFLMSGKDNLQN